MNTRTTLILAVLALVVAGYLFIAKPWEEHAADGKKETSLAKLLYDPKPKDIDKVELVLNGKNKLIFKKQGENWQIDEPIKAPANDYEVNGMVDKVGEIKYVKSYDKSDKERPNDAVSGLDKPTAVVKLYAGDKSQAEVAVGGRVPTGLNTYIRKGGDDAIYEANSDLTSSFNKKLDSVRNRNLVKFELKDVKHVTVEGVQNYKLTQPKEGTWVIDSPTRGRGDKEQVEKIVRPISSLYVQDFKDDDLGLKVYQLDKPRLKITIQTSKQIPAKNKPGDPNTKPADTQPSTEEKTYTLLMGGATDPSATSYFAKLDSARSIFSIAENTVKDLSVPVTELRDKQIAKGDNSNAQVTTIEAKTPGGQMALKRGANGEWTFADGMKADSAAVDDLTKTIQNLKATGIEAKPDPLATFDWDHPRGEIKLTRTGDEHPTKLLIGNPSSSGQLVYVKNDTDDTPALVSKSDADQILAPPVAYQDRSVLKFPRDEANKIEISQADGQKVTLEKKADKWSLTAPVQATADADAVRNLVTDLSSLRAKKVVANGDKSKYGLDNPQVKLDVYTQAPVPRPPATAPAVAHTPARPFVSTKPSVSAAKPSTTLVAHSPVGSQPAAANLAPDDHAAMMAATRPAARHGEQPLDVQIKKLEELLEYQTTTIRAKGEENPKATAMLEEKLAALRAQAAAASQPAIKGSPQGPENGEQGTGSQSQPAIQGAQQGPAEGTAGVQTQPAASTQPAAPPPPVIKVYHLLLSQQNGVTYAARDDQPLVYEIDSKIFEDAKAEMHDRQVLKFDVANAIDLGFDHDGVQVAVHKSGNDWKYVADPAVPIDNQKVTEVLNVFRDLKTHKYVAYDNADPAKYGFDKDVQRMWVVLEGGQRLEVLLSKTGPADDKDKSKYAMLAGAKSVFLLKDDQAKKFAQKLEDFQKTATTPGAGTPSATPSGSVP